MTFVFGAAGVCTEQLNKLLKTSQTQENIYLSGRFYSVLIMLLCGICLKVLSQVCISVNERAAVYLINL